jgi:hypothetical protein
MRTDLLTVSLVEELHWSVLQGKDISGIVSGLVGATLPGLLEFGCLRWSQRDGSVPGLPERVAASDLGRALAAVPSPLGFRSNGAQPRPVRRLDPRPAEFRVLRGEDDVLGDGWDHFAGRFEVSARGAGFSAAAAARLQLALYAMAENAVIHAEAPAILVGYEASPGTALFGVADVGIGVLVSLHKNPAFAHLRLHNEAIRTALRDGATSRLPEEGGGGFGFRDVFAALADQWGSLRFRSGEGCVTMDGTALDANYGAVSHPPPLPGFQVMVCSRTGSPGWQPAPPK